MPFMKAVLALAMIVPTPVAAAPRLDWYPCGFAGLPAGQCDTVKLPVDHAKPRGATTEIALFRVPARKPQSKIGSLFIGPGLPGWSAIGTAASHTFRPGAQWFSDAVLDRFDIVMADPRGTGFSDNAACFATEREQLAALGGIPNNAPPTDANEAKAFLASAKKLGAACATRGRPLSGRMSTAETARDLDLLRQAVGDAKLTYVGTGYGSVVGQYYAAMFPGRVRALALDSVLDANAWVGAGTAGGKPIYDRLRVVDARRAAVREVLARCGPAGPERCRFAVGGGDPAAKYDTMIELIRKKPIVLPPVDGQPATTFTYGGWLYISNYAMQAGGFSAAVLVDLAADLYNAGAPTATVADRVRAARTYRNLRARGVTPPIGFAYHNGLEAASSVVCADGRHPAKSAQWPSMIVDLGKRVPDYAPYAWNSAQCATDLWRARDPGAYTGPFTSTAPILLTSNRYGWTADYGNAVTVHKRLPNSRLLPNSGWGLSALGTSQCMTTALDTYLLSVALPKPGSSCTADDQPYPTVAR